jgi:hypothetical protein
MLTLSRRFAFICAIGLLCVAGFRTPAVAYPQVHLVNKSEYQAAVTITYAACKTDHRIAGARASLLVKRGFCLLTSIRATIAGQGPVTPYTSSGTSFNNFVLEPTHTGFHIIRV